MGVRALSRRVLRPKVIGVVGVLFVAGIVALQVAPSKGPGLQRSETLACADVAATAGLTFFGSYGEVFPTQDTMGNLMQRNMGNGAAVGDYNGDGYLDVFLLGQAGHASKLFRNDAGPFGYRVFTDVTTEAGITVTSSARAAQFVDLSGSGRPDLVIAADYMTGGPAGPSQILRNNGDGTFTDVTAGSGFDPTGYIIGGMTFADYDGSGRMSIYVTLLDRGAGRRPRTGHHHPGHVAGPQPPLPQPRQLHVRGRDRDRARSASTTATHSPRSSRTSPATAGPTSTRPTTTALTSSSRTWATERSATSRYESGLTRKGNSMGVATGVGPNGALNLYVTNITDPGRRFGTNQGNTYFMSTMDEKGIHFANEAPTYGIADTAWGWGTAFVDLDGDGDQDLYTAQGMREFVGNGSTHLFNANSFLFMNDGTGQNFGPSTAPGCEVPGDQRALIVMDFNRDGAPDLLMTQVNAAPILLENLIADRNWLTVAPGGPGDAGVNARISVTAGGRTINQIVLAGGSYLAGPPREAYFGLGTATVADKVVIQWASGKTTELTNVPAGQVLRVTAP